MDENKTPAATNAVDKKNRYIEIAAGIFLIAGTIWILLLLLNLGRYIKTNNAQVDANIASVNARVSGNILEIRFDSYTEVNAGDTLVLLDDAEFIIKVNQAKADLEIAKANLLAMDQSVKTSFSHQQAASAKLKGNVANLERAEKNYERFENMYADSAVTRNQFDQIIAQWKSEQAYLEASEKEAIASQSTTEQYKSNCESAEATVMRKQADLDAAMLQLSYTRILAPADGIIGERTIQIGELVNNNQTLAAIVQNDNKWVMANFKETQMEKLMIGQKVKISIDALGGRKFNGVIKDLSPATGAKFSMIEPDNSTGNFVKITQRVPVKIDFEATPEELEAVKPGMNVTVKVKK